MRKYKVLSLLQPWASLVVKGHKLIETRSWKTDYRGELLIHASRPRKTRETVKLMMEWRKLFDIEDVPPYFSLPFGSIVGKVDLVDTIPSEIILAERTFTRPDPDCHYKTWTLTDKEICFGNYDCRRHGWLLSDPVEFEEPIPAKGNLSLWDWEGELQRKVKAPIS